MRVADLENRRVNEPAGGVVGMAADDDKVFGTGSGERLGMYAELGCVDHRADVRVRLGRVADHDLLGEFDEPVFERRPQAARDVQP